MKSDRIEAASRGNARVVLGLQLALTLAVLALVPGGWPKLFGLLLCWAVTFRALTKKELLAFLAVSMLFSVMDIMAVRQEAFRFSSPDYLGLPVWEIFMWGFYVLHALRMLGGSVPTGQRWLVVALAVLFAVPFVTLNDAWVLLAASGGALALALVFFHDPGDWVYVGYMIMVGAFVEYTGVWSNLWGYPGSVPGGVPPWFVTMWGGVGLFTRRLLVPLLYSGGSSATPKN